MYYSSSPNTFFPPLEDCSESTFRLCTVSLTCGIPPDINTTGLLTHIQPALSDERHDVRPSLRASRVCQT